MPEDPTWDDDLGVDEEVSEEEVKNAEDMGKAPVGKFLVECTASKPVALNFKEYSCKGANLTLRIEKCLEVDGKPVKGDEGEIYEGRNIFDTIALYSPKEKEGMKKRRILVAKRTGLIGNSTGKITQVMWSHVIIGKQVVITHIDDKWTGTDGVEQVRRKVAFDGYDYAETADATPAGEEPDIDDI